MSTPTLPELLARHHALALAYVDGVLRILRGCEARAYNPGTGADGQAAWTRTVVYAVENYHTGEVASVWRTRELAEQARAGDDGLRVREHDVLGEADRVTSHQGV